jgi:hypothetical protein
LLTRRPRLSTSWSTRRVETPQTYACWTTETSACSERLRGCRNDGKTALAQLRDLQLDLARARIPAPRPIAVAMRRPILRSPLAELGPDQLGHLDLHQLLHDPAHAVADHIAVLISEHLPDDLLDRHPVCSGHPSVPPLNVETWNSRRA